MIRAHLLACIQAAFILGCVLSLNSALDRHEEKARAEQAREAQATRAAQADQVLGIVRLAAR